MTYPDFTCMIGLMRVAVDFFASVAERRRLSRVRALPAAAARIVGAEACLALCWLPLSRSWCLPPRPPRASGNRRRGVWAEPRTPPLVIVGGDGNEGGVRFRWRSQTLRRSARRGS
jgi:hypothetical protein